MGLEHPCSNPLPVERWSSDLGVDVLRDLHDEPTAVAHEVQLGRDSLAPEHVLLAAQMLGDGGVGERRPAPVGVLLDAIDGVDDLLDVASGASHPVVRPRRASRTDDRGAVQPELDVLQWRALLLGLLLGRTAPRLGLALALVDDRLFVRGCVVDVDDCVGCRVDHDRHGVRHWRRGLDTDLAVR